MTCPPWPGGSIAPNPKWSSAASGRLSSSMAGPGPAPEAWNPCAGPTSANASSMAGPSVCGLVCRGPCRSGGSAIGRPKMPFHVSSGCQPPCFRALAPWMGPCSKRCRSSKGMLFALPMNPASCLFARPCLPKEAPSCRNEKQCWLARQFNLVGLSACASSGQALVSGGQLPALTPNDCLGPITQQPSKFSNPQAQQTPPPFTP